MTFRLPKPIRDWIRSKNLPPDKWREVSECCGAGRWRETSRCEDCKEIANFIEVNY